MNKKSRQEHPIVNGFLLILMNRIGWWGNARYSAFGNHDYGSVPGKGHGSYNAAF